jgi:hypothetical protein
MSVTNVGILTERQAAIFYDVAERVRNSGAMGSMSVLDAPDEFAADPLVQLVVALTASDSDAWLALEFLQNQFNPNFATGRFLQDLHLTRYGITETGLSLEQARALVKQLQLNGVKPSSPEAAVMRLPSVIFAKTIYSKQLALVPPLNAGETMLVVMPKAGMTIPSGAIAQTLFENIGDGFYNWVGDVQDTYEYKGYCHAYYYQPAEPVIIAVKMFGNLNECTDAAWHTAANTLIENANCSMQFELGAKIDGQALLQIIGPTPGININRIEVQRRAKPLTPTECLAQAETLTFKDCSGIETTQLWASDKWCGYAQGEIWCKDFIDCLNLQPWEYPVFHPSFFEFAEESSPC